MFVLKRSYDGLVPDIIAHLPFAISGLEPVTGGFSYDGKFKLYTADGALLLRISQLDQSPQRQAEFAVLHQLREMGLRCSQPLYFGSMPEATLCYGLFTYLEGIDAERGLPQLTDKQAYAIGLEAGKELKLMHQLRPTTKPVPWQTRLQKKYRKYRGQYDQSNYHLPAADYLGGLIEANWSLLDDTEDLFQHDDFHVGNIIIQDGRYVGVIDFNRMDWGDPWYEMTRAGWFSRRISIPFCLGQLEGYFAGPAPLEFWERYRLYMATSIFSMIVWHLNFYPELLPQAEQLINMVLADHDQFRRPAPFWYG